MAPKRRISIADGQAALNSWLPARTGAIPRSVLLCAVRYSLEELAERHPGRSVEVRVPPAGAVQVREGTTHRRGTPPAVVETDMETWLQLATGVLKWEKAWHLGKIQASGQGAQLADLLPVFPVSVDEDR